MNIFRSSGKRHLILTGERGSGKTTLLKKLLALYGKEFCKSAAVCPSDLPGFTTYAVRENTSGNDSYKTMPSYIRLTDHTTGNETVIGIPKNGSMQPVADGFLSVGIDAVSHALHASEDFVCIDEIGFLEEGCPQFTEAIWNLFEKKRVIAVLRSQKLPFLEKLKNRPDVLVYCIDSFCNNSGSYDRKTPEAGGSVDSNRNVCDTSGIGAHSTHTETPPKIGIVVKASGKSRRFGSDKLLADFHGKPLIQRALDTITALKDHAFFVSAVAVTRSVHIQQLCIEQDFPCIFHDLPHLNDTIRLGLDHLILCDACIFLQGDQPLLTADSVKALILAFIKDQRFIYRLSYEGRPGSPVLFPASFFPELLELPEDCGGSIVIRRHPEMVRLVPCADASELIDADTPETLEKLSGYYSLRSQ